LAVRHMFGCVECDVDPATKGLRLSPRQYQGNRNSIDNSTLSRLRSFGGHEPAFPRRINDVYVTKFFVLKQMVNTTFMTVKYPLSNYLFVFWSNIGVMQCAKWRWI